MTAAMPPVSYSVPTEYTSPRFAQAFAAGCGGAVESADSLRPGPVALFGSPRRWSLLLQAIAEGRTWYYGDHGYFGRYETVRVTRNAFQHDGRAETGAPPDPARLEAFGLRIAPWRKSGGHVLICPPDARFAALFGFDAAAWTRNVSAALAALTDRPLRIRERPRARVRPGGGPSGRRGTTVVSAGPSLAEDLAGAWCLVTYRSNAALEALMAGIPVICTGACAARRLGSGDLADVVDPPTPDGRFELACRLAANQWTLAEIRAGAAWRAIGDQGTEDRGRETGEREVA